MPARSAPALAAGCLGALLFLLATACSHNSSTEDQVRDFSARFVHESLALSPVEATAAGYHRHGATNLDALLDDYTPAGISRLTTFYDHSMGEASNLTSSDLPEESQADLDIIRQQCGLQLLELSNLQTFRHNPTLYVESIGNAIYTPFILGYAPEPQRFADIIARLEKIPAFLSTARHNLEDSPAIWNRVAQSENEGNITLIDQTIRAKIPPDLATRYNGAASSAIAALRSFDDYLHTDLVHRESTWRLGPARYAAKSRLSFTAGRTPQQILADAEGQLQSIRHHMYTEAAALYGKYFPNRNVPSDVDSAVSSVLGKIAEVHAQPANYFDEAKRDLAEATAFVQAQQLLALPPKSNLQVIPTPEFMRGIYSVGGFSPAPALEPELGSYYWITPFTADMDEARIESKLREYNRYGLQLLTIHEAMPGHYLQFEYADRVQPATRRILRALFSNNPYVEGWAVHATEMMIDAGYERSPEMQLTWEKHLLRVIANAILDVKLQTMNMTDDQALHLMIDQAFQEKEEAVQKLQRAKLSSCQLPAYFVGWRAWDQLENNAKRKEGAGFRLDRFNERALNEGAVPMPVLRRLLF